MSRQGLIVRWLALAFLVAVGYPARGAAWESALREQTDPAKLASLGKRGANPRVNRVVFYMHQAQGTGITPDQALDRVFQQNGTTGLVAVLSKETSLLNYAHALEWGLLSEANLEKLKRGQTTTITKGPYQNDTIDVDHIVPVSLAPEAGNLLANLELQPASVNRSKGARVGLHEVQFAKRLHEAGLIQDRTLWRVRWVFFYSKVVPWLTLAGLLVFVWLSKRSGPSGWPGWPGPFLAGLLRGLLCRF